MSLLSNGPYRASYGGLEGILTGLTKSTDHASWGCTPEFWGCRGLLLKRPFGLYRAILRLHWGWIRETFLEVGL